MLAVRSCKRLRYRRYCLTWVYLTRILTVSYLDTQLSRVGRNWRQIPINKPVCPYRNLLRDGQMQMEIPHGPNYYPNSGTSENPTQHPHPTSAADGAHTESEYPVNGLKKRQRGPKFTNEGDQPYNQATLFYNSMSETEKEHMVSAAVFELGHCIRRDVQSRMMERFAQIHPDFGTAVAEGFGIKFDVEKIKKERNYTTAKSDLSQLSPNNTYTFVGRKVGIMALDGFDGAQVTAMKKAYEAAGLIVMLVGSRHGPCYPEGVEVGDEKAAGDLRAEFTPESCRSTYFDALAFLGSSDAYLKALKQGRVIHFAVRLIPPLEADFLIAR